PSLEADLVAAAERSGRSVSEEIERRLEASTQREKALEERVKKRLAEMNSSLSELEALIAEVAKQDEEAQRRFAEVVRPRLMMAARIIESLGLTAKEDRLRVEERRRASKRRWDKELGKS